MFRYIDRYRYLGHGSVYLENGYVGNVTEEILHRVYNKGSWVLHMLRHWVGNQVFYNILHEYLSTYKWNHASTEQFRDVCVNVTGDTRLNTFFHEWIYSDYHPVYESWFFVRDDGKIFLNLKQTQTPSIDPYVPEVYHMPIDIILDDGVAKETLTVFNDQRDQNFVLETSLTSPPLRADICLDWLLGEVTECHFVHNPLTNGVIGYQYQDTVVFVCSSNASLGVVEGQLPDGLSLENTTGIISGTPTKTGVFPFTVRAALSEQGPFYYDYDTIVVCRKWVVKPDHTGDVPTIQAAIDSASNCDTVLLMDGTFWGDGNRDITFQAKPIIVRSQHGADACTLDCSRNTFNVDIDIPHRGFFFHSQEGSGSLVEGVTIINGRTDQNQRGGGILCVDTSPTIKNCKILGNGATDGGGIACYNNASPTIIQCVITGNKAYGGDGGGIYCSNNSSPTIVSCTISGNKANRGGGISQLDTSNPYLTRSIVWGNCATSSVDGNEWYCDGSIPSNCCSDVDASGFGELCVFISPGCPEESLSISADPLFCHPISCNSAPTISGDYYIQHGSPCEPLNSAHCGLIGALVALSGDCTGNGIVDAGDIVYLINYLFKGGPAPNPLWMGDVTCNGVVDAGDVVYLVNYLFKGGPPPCCHCP
ncbi:MAG: right-handed parallel beta-helix repeat-containing protein [Candidatus Zixiibacteriota bacterium]